MDSLRVKARRLKIKLPMRRMIKETQLTLDDLIYSISVDANLEKPVEIQTMPGIFRFPIKAAVEKVKEILDLGIHAVYIIGIPKKKDNKASDAYSSDGVVQQVSQRIKEIAGDNIVIIGDSYLGYFTDHQIGGILDEKKRILDKPTLETVRKIAVKWAESGVDVICCSTMVDGRVQAAREALDEAGFDETLIMGSIKFNSAFYLAGAGFTATGESYSYDKGVYYFDPANSEDPMRMARLDVEQGADIINVKPATPYYDIIYMIKNSYGIPVSAYSISGDYAMVSFGSQKGNLNEKDCALELLTSIKRAGADMIINYWAPEVAKWL